jgi:hypothetical protein
LIFANVLKDHPAIANKTSAEAKHYKETSFINNPYLSGGKKENFNPYTGLEKAAVQTGKAAQDSKARGANFQGKQGKGRWEPYNAGNQREENSYRGRGNPDGPRYRDSRNNRDSRDRRNDSDREPSRQQDNGDRFKGYKSQQGNQRDTLRNQNKTA